jgi:hypothetical protein
MRTLSMAFVGGFAGASMAGNVATLHAAPLPTNVAGMKSSRQFDPGPVGGWRAASNAFAFAHSPQMPRMKLTSESGH